MTVATQYIFEGKSLTLAQIRERVPCLPVQTIRRHLAAGRNTATAMLTFSHSEASAVGGRKVSAAAKARGERIVRFGRRR